MTIIDLIRKTQWDTKNFPENGRDSGEFFILCHAPDVPGLRAAFALREKRPQAGDNLDESVRYICYDGYDYISAVLMELRESEWMLREINLYISPRFLIVVMPVSDSERLAAFEKKLLEAANTLAEKPNRITGLYFFVLNELLSDCSGTLEVLEDRMESLSETIVSGAEKGVLSQIDRHRNMSYTAKKQLRAMSYLGDQLLLDENKLIDKNEMRYFRSIDTRLKRLYDFSESLHHLSSELLSTYDSRLSMKTNDTVNKLTAFTVFFGPLTVIAGIYGMNFTYMPELNWRFGYPLALAVMIGVSLALFIILKKKRWL